MRASHRHPFAPGVIASLPRRTPRTPWRAPIARLLMWVAVGYLWLLALL